MFSDSTVKNTKTSRPVSFYLDNKSDIDMQAIIDQNEFPKSYSNEHYLEKA